MGTSAWTRQRVEQLAPDTASAGAASALARRGVWQSLGASDEYAWGECQGSGATPYQVRVDLRDGAATCSCPSRKLPCKHVLALLLKHADSALPRADPPAFVQEWVSRRATAEDKKAARAARVAAPPDPLAQARRLEKREGRIDVGLAQLDAWLADIVTQGLAAVRTQPFAFWEQMAARLVDAQAPGLARRVRALGTLAASSGDWQARLLTGLSRLQLLMDAYRRIDSLPPPLAAEVRTLVGWTQSQEALLAREGLRDRWLVSGVRRIEDEQFSSQYTWLRGTASGRIALVLDFTVGNQPPRAVGVTGQVLDLDLVFFDGEPPLRALIRTHHGMLHRANAFPGACTLSGTQAEIAALLARNPFLERWPVTLGPVSVRLDGDRCTLVDADGASTPTVPYFRHGWHLLSLARFGPVHVFGEWTSLSFEPVSVLSRGLFFELTMHGDVPVAMRAA